MRKRLHTETSAVRTLTVEYITLRHLVREGACPVMEVVAVYPVVSGLGDDAATERFNRGYREAAEAFVTWAVTHPAAETQAEFAALGVGAAYRYDRRCFICRFEINSEADGTATDAQHLSVTRTVADGRRRGGISATYVERWLWRLSDGTIQRRVRKTGR